MNRFLKEEGKPCSQILELLSAWGQSHLEFRISVESKKRVQKEFVNNGAYLLLPDGTKQLNRTYAFGASSLSSLELGMLEFFKDIIADSTNSPHGLSFRQPLEINEDQPSQFYVSCRYTRLGHPSDMIKKEAV